MKRIILAAVAAMTTASPALAADPFAPAYGNTVTQTMPDGTKIVILVNEDKTWEQRIGDKTMKGTYAWKDDTHVCFTVTDPAPADPSKATMCSEIKGDHKVGDTWTEALPNGGAMTVAITAGR
jgi:hypothetical protein